MMPALRDYALLWSTALASRDARAAWAFRLLAVVVPLTVGFLVWNRTGDVFEAFGFAVRVPVAIFMFAALTFYVPGAIRLNTPANARLVPRMRRRLVELTLLVWVVFTAAAVLMAWGTPLPATLVAMATLAWLAGLGLASAGYQAGMIVQVSLLFGVIFRMHVPASLFEQPMASGIALLLLALAARTLGLMFPNGGDRHWERRGAQARALERTKPEGLMRQASGMRFGGALYAAALRRHSTTPRAPAFQLSVLGPAMHWSQRYLPLLVLVVFVAAVLTLVRIFVGDAVAETKWLVLLCQAMLFAQLFTYEQRNVRLSDTRTEQALLRMAPPTPAAAHRFNRQLNAALLRMAVLDWAALVAALLGISAFAGIPGEGLLLTAQLCCLTLPLVAANVRDHARHRTSGLLRLVGGLLAAVATSLGSALMARELAGTPVLPVAASVSIVLALIVTVGRWRSAVAAPHAFPAGRFA